ncbi:BA75_01222T0 [Komagataella pastoris]|uniref:Cullin-5 n=1 Tax=Komagataella pastoris TaxID=4922 RepID=A0A1B2J8V5_PICPA|nr:BA75_01222T0 [Komagataella pastoris]
MAEKLPKSDDLKATWSFVEPGLQLILGSDSVATVTPKMYMNVYTAIYNYCINKSRTPTQDSSYGSGSNSTTNASLVGGEIYLKLQQYLIEYIQQLEKKPEESFLQFYVRRWVRFTIGAGYLNNVFDYMNRYWVKKERSNGRRDIYDVNTLCLLTWRDFMFRPNLEILLEEILTQVELQRLHKIELNMEISFAIKSFVSLGFDINDLKKQNLSVYITDFEKAYLDATLKFYIEESDEFLETNGVVEYMKKVDTRLAEENSRANIILIEHTKRPLADVLNNALIERHVEVMYEEFNNLLDQKQTEDIYRMYSLLQRIPPTLEPLLIKFEAYVKQQGLKAVAELKQSQAAAESTGPASKKYQALLPKLYIKTLLQVYERFNEVVYMAFGNNPLFVKSLDNACRDYINNNSIAMPGIDNNGPTVFKGNSKTPELLARYGDTLLKKKAKDSDATADMSADELMNIFKFIADKDAFETHYRRLLARRLINGNMVSEEEEESIIQKLKEFNSLEYTTKMSNMFADMKASKDLRYWFKEQEESDNTDLNIFVLSQTAWPFPQFKQPFTLPDELLGTKEQFEKLYSEKHSGRRLKWLWNLCRGEMKANLARPGKPPFILTVNLFQMSILLPFNKRETYSFEELHEITNLTPEHLESCITPLVKYKLLVQSPEGSENTGKSSTKFTVVNEYKSKKMKVNFMQGVKLDQKHDHDDAQKEIEDDRRSFLQACIVRIMKARKVLKHSALINEVVQQSHARFQPSVGDIKKAIDLLIEKEYLNRVDGDSYEYLA